MSREKSKNKYFLLAILLSVIVLLTFFSLNKELLPIMLSVLLLMVAPVLRKDIIIKIIAILLLLIAWTYCIVPFQVNWGKVFPQQGLLEVIPILYGDLNPEELKEVQLIGEKIYISEQNGQLHIWAGKGVLSFANPRYLILLRAPVRAESLEEDSARTYN